MVNRSENEGHAETGASDATVLFARADYPAERDSRAAVIAVSPARPMPAGLRHTGRQTPLLRVLLGAPQRVRHAIAGAVCEEALLGHGFLFLPVFIGAGAATWLTLPAVPSIWPISCASASFFIAAVMVRGYGVMRGLLLAASLFLCGMLLAEYQIRRASTVILDSAVTTDITGTVERSEMVGGERMRYLVRLTGTANPTIRRPPQLVSLVVRARHAPFQVGTVMSGRARLSPPSGPALPGLHDFGFAAYFDGIGAVGYVYSVPVASPLPRAVQRGWFDALAQSLYELRAKIGNRIRAIAPGDGGAFAAAIVTDERRAISSETVEALRVSGLAHIVAISGLNMALAGGISFVGLRSVLALFPAVAQALAVKKIAAVGALFLVTAYYLISGFGVSAQRAYIMIAVMLVAVLLDRPSISLRNVAISALIILAWSPSEVLGASFQMSFAATAALVAGYAAWARRMQARAHEPFPLRHPAVTAVHAGWNFLLGILVTSLIGSLATAIFSIEHFHRLATYGLAANLAAMPIISFLVMPLGLAAMLAMPFGLDAPFIVAMAASLDWVIAIAAEVASWGGDVAIGQQHPWFMPLGASGLLLLLLLRTGLRFSGLAFLAAAVAVFWSGMERPKASLLVSEDGRLAGYRSDGAIALNRARPPGFIRDQWVRARRLPQPTGPVLITTPAAKAANGSAPSAADDERLAEPVLAEARRMMREVGKDRFSCVPKAWCAMMSPDGVLVVLVEDGRYAGAACDVAGLVVAARSRFDACRSGTPLLSGNTLRKTGAMEIDFSGTNDPHGWQVTASIGQSVRPWSAHRHFDWRRGRYDGSLPEWLAAKLENARPSGEHSPSRIAERAVLPESPAADADDAPGVSDSGE